MHDKGGARRRSGDDSLGGLWYICAVMAAFHRDGRKTGPAREQFAVGSFFSVVPAPAVGSA